MIVTTAVVFMTPRVLDTHNGKIINWRDTALRGSESSIAVERTPCNREAMGLNPAECRAFFSSLSSQYCILNSGTLRSCNTTYFSLTFASPCNLKQNKLNRHGLKKYIQGQV